MPAKRVTTATAAASSISGASGSTTNNNGPSGGGTRPLEALNGMTRLTPARDLTLGGRGAGVASKKVFAPNLNAVRNKNANVKTSKDTTQPRSGRRGGRGNGTGATRGRGGNSGGSNSTLIQTVGLFSEGAGDVHVRRSTGNGTAYSRGGEEVSVIRKRLDRKDDKNQDQRIKELLGESEASDAELSEEEANKTEMALKPILLKEGLWVNQSTPVVKQEEDSSSTLTQKDTLAVAQHLQQLHVAAMSATLEEPPVQYGRYPRSIGNFLDSSQSQIFIMQLPDVLPSVTDDSEETEPAAGDPIAPSDSEPPSPAANPTSGSKESVLRQLEEGQIGKILRYKSGRVKLQLGDTLFDLDMGLDPGFLQELMSVTANREQRSANMINLGPIQAKLKATPDWVHLFGQQEAASKRTNPLPST